MSRIMFCEIAWMRYYAGVTEDDKPSRGGTYIKENGVGGEVFNFTPHNHTCYGYVMHYGDELHIERLQGVRKSDLSEDDITVVWVATDGKSSKIVGFYEHCTVYRLWQTMFDNNLDNPSWDFNFTADEKDVYLIPEEKRSFEIPRAPKEGKGRGMGQSQVYYADSDYAKEFLIPEVLKYIESIKPECIPICLSKEELNAKAEDSGCTVDQLIDEAVKKSNEFKDIEALQLMNLAVSKEDSAKTRMNRADCFNLMCLYKEAECDLLKAFEMNPDSITIIQMLMFACLMNNHCEKAAELGEILRARRTEHASDWAVDAQNLFATYIMLNDTKNAYSLIDECEQEADKYNFEFLDDAIEGINNIEDSRRFSF